MYQMVGADTKAVSVTGDDPHLQVRPAQAQTRGNSRRPAMNGVKTVGIHVIGEAAGTTDSGNKHDVLARNLQFLADSGHHALYLRQY